MTIGVIGSDPSYSYLKAAHPIILTPYFFNSAKALLSLSPSLERIACDWKIDSKIR